MHNNSEGKKQQVEDHHGNFKFSNNKMSVTVCNDSLNAKTSNVNFVCVTCEKFALNDNHDMCVLHYINGVNSRTKMHMAMPISTREPKRTMNQSVATPLKRTVASESTNQKPRSTTRKQYKQISKTCKWWWCKITLPVYKWKPKSRTVNIEPNVSMPLGTKSRITNISEPTTLRKSIVLNTPLSSNSFAARKVKFGNDQIALILGYGDMVQGNVTIKRVYYVEGLNHNLFSVGQFCDADLEVSFRKSICYIRDLKGNDLLIAWLWHRRLSHLNFDTINLLSKYDTVTCLPKLKFFKYHLCSSCELGKAKWYSTQSRAYRVYNKRTRVIVETIHVNFDELPQMASDHFSSDPAPQSETVTTSNELDLLFSRMFDELLNGTTPVVSKSSVVTATDAPNQRQQQHTTPSTSTTVALIEIILFIIDSRCSKHMMGNLKLLSNFVEQFLGMVKFGNDQIAPILGYGDLVQGNVTIKRGSRGTDLYSITLQNTSTPNLICLMAKATSSQAWF
ncbi:retrovirus-related pol polyprotein from transposon TNT 1-94 [Tanacetum coccineum]